MKLKFLLILVLFISCETFGNKGPDYISQDVALEDYLPFHSSKLASLRGSSSLTLTGELPVLDGATALFPVYASFVQAAYPQADYVRVHPKGTLFAGRYDFDSGIVRCTTTPWAYASLINGGADIIFCMEPSKEQIEEADADGITFHMTSIGKDAFVFIVNTDNPVNNITSEQIRMIYSGRITNWKEIGGNDEEIIPYQRNKDSGSQTLFESIMGETPIMEPLTSHGIGSMGRVITAVSSYTNYPNAIGYSFLFYTTEMANRKKIKLLAIDGVTPSRETIKSGEYVFSSTFYAITRGDESENAKKFINWILSEEGQYLVEKTGYVPVK
jgi:phosphate transport system substrate-binding protein